MSKNQENSDHLAIKNPEDDGKDKIKFVATVVAAGAGVICAIVALISLGAML